VIQPRSLRLDGKYPEDAAAARQALLDAGADVMVVAAYGLILPQWVLDLPPKGCLNIHGSILPRWRGAAPIHRAIEAGDAETGVTIMQMDIGLDTGDMCVLERLPISETDTTASLHDKLAVLGGRLIVEALEMSACGGLPRTPQPAEGITYAHKIEKAESAMDWRLSAAVLDRRLRAFNPFPGGSTQLGAETIKLWAASPEAFGGQAQPGQVLAADADGVLVACGEGALRLTQLQRAGGKKLAAGDFLRGFEIPVGTLLQLPEQP
jgi:methionyl-tRNA formyltransferase